MSDRKFITQLCLAANSYSGLYLLGGIKKIIIIIKKPSAAIFVG